MRRQANPQYTKIREFLTSLRTDGAEGVRPPAEGDEFAQLEAEVRLIGEELTQLRRNAREAEGRLNAFSAMLAALVSFNLSYRLEISEKGDIFDGFAYSLNILAEELATTAVSREYFDKAL